MSLEEILRFANDLWPKGNEDRWCVLTGGEPLLQVDIPFLRAFKGIDWKIAVETNGTIRLNPTVRSLIDWVCVSPKRGSKLVIDSAEELKVVLPGSVDENDLGWSDSELHNIMSNGSWDNAFVQPLDFQNGFKTNIERCLEFVRSHPSWRLSLQTHKFIGIP